MLCTILCYRLVNATEIILGMGWANERRRYTMQHHLIPDAHGITTMVTFVLVDYKMLLF